MPVRNVNKIDVADSYYHVYTRGAAKQKIFLDSEDYKFFFGLFERYLSDEQQTDSIGVPYPHLRDEIEILAFCLMQNHFHLLVYQQEIHAMTRLMRSLLTSYSRYYNRKYKRSGPVFETRYKATLIQHESYLLHISRYIHLNPRVWRTARYSSIRYYLDNVTSPEWLHTSRVTMLFGDKPSKYEAFVAEYADRHAQLEDLKGQLADM